MGYVEEKIEECIDIHAETLASEPSPRWKGKKCGLSRSHATPHITSSQPHPMPPLSAPQSITYINIEPNITLPSNNMHISLTLILISILITFAVAGPIKCTEEMTGPPTGCASDAECKNGRICCRIRGASFPPGPFGGVRTVVTIRSGRLIITIHSASQSTPLASRPTSAFETQTQRTEGRLLP